MATYIRCGLIRNLSHRYISGLLTVNKYARTSRLIASQPHRDAKDDLIVEIHRKIDYNLGISSDLFTTFYTSLTKFDAVTERDIGLLLHICSVGPFDVPVEKRLTYLDEIWNRLGELGIQPTTRLYNVKLRAYCASKKQFNPLDELMTMKSLGLNPDKVTYQLLIEGFCQKGDINGANVVLEAMEASNYVLNLYIFNSFITGHLKAGSPVEAANVLEILSSKGLSPTSETFYRFAAHYAEEGDIGSVMKYIHDANAAGVPLPQNLLLDIYQALVSSGHGSKAGELLNYLSNVGLYTSTTLQRSCQLLSEGFIDAAFELYLKVPKVEEGTLAYHTGSTLLKTMVINNRSAQEIMSMADKIQEISPKSLSHQNSLLYAYKENKIELALQLIELMHAKNLEMKATYIIPAVCHYRNNNNKEGVYKTVRMLMELTSGADIAEQILFFGYPALLAVNETNETILQEFKGNEKFLSTIFFCSVVVNHGYKQAVNSIVGKELSPSLMSLICSSIKIAKAKYLVSELESCVSVLESIHQIPDISKDKFKVLLGDVLFYFLLNKDFVNAEKFLSLIADKKLRLNHNFQNIKFPVVMPKNLSDKISECCGKSNLKRDIDEENIIRAMSEDLYLSKSKPFSTVIKQFNEAIRDNNLEEMKRRYRELQTAGFTMKPFHLKNYIIKLTQLGDVDTALNLFQELRNKGDGMFDRSIPLSLGAALVKKGDVHGTLEMLKAFTESKLDSDERFTNFDTIKTILTESPGIQDAQNFHQTIVKNKIVSDNDILRVHQIYVNRILSLSDDDDVVKYLMDLHERCHVFPNAENVLMRFIAKKDVARLKRVMDLGLVTLGNNYFHHLLAFSFLQCGLPNKAAVILQTPGLKINEKLIFDKCQYYIRQKKIDWLSAMVDLTEAMPISRSLMLKYLAEGYIAMEDLTKATDVLQRFLNDFIDPPKDLLRQLINAYRAAKKDLPAVLQAYEPIKKRRTKSDLSQGTSEIPKQENVIEKETV
ncbi:hypothetical protein Btru_003097 [Bulinus truncatus]|nr:hypothetical protein Btru_003097 [Bulinus truncatus]